MRPSSRLHDLVKTNWGLEAYSICGVPAQSRRQTYMGSCTSLRLVLVEDTQRTTPRKTSAGLCVQAPCGGDGIGVVVQIPSYVPYMCIHVHVDARKWHGPLILM